MGTMTDKQCDRQAETEINELKHILVVFYVKAEVWRSDNVVVHINEVVIRRPCS